MVADLEMPAWQWTNTLPPASLMESMKSIASLNQELMSSDSLGQLSCQELGQELGSQPSRDYNFSATPQLAENFCDFCEPLWQMRPAQGGDQKARKVRRFLMFFTNIHMHLYTHTHTVSHIYISTQT